LFSVTASTNPCLVPVASLHKRIELMPLQAEIVGRAVTYLQTVVDKPTFKVYEDLPQFSDDFLISFSKKGHVILWYKGMGIDSAGIPFYNIKTFIRQQAALPAGFVFAFNIRSDDFAQEFFQYLSMFTNKGAATCISAACVSLKALKLNTIADKTYLTPAGFLKRLVDLKVASEGSGQGAGSVKLISLGYGNNNSVLTRSAAYTDKVLSKLVPVVGLSLVGAAIESAQH
jgi:hypothetical protein